MKPPSSPWRRDVTHLLNRLSIRGKVIAAFAAVLVCTVGLGFFAIQRLDAVNANAQAFRDDYLPSTRTLGHMAQLSERLRMNQGGQLLAVANSQHKHAAAVIKEQL